MIEVKEVEIEEAIKVHKNVIEFDELNPTKEHFENRYKDKKHVIIVAYYNNVPVGYIIGYDKFEDGESFYCWMAGVDINYRRLGALTSLMEYQEKWAREQGYKVLKIKTRNNKRNMLSFLVKNNFYFTSVEQRENIEDNRINLQKNL